MLAAIPLSPRFWRTLAVLALLLMECSGLALLLHGWSLLLGSLFTPPRSPLAFGRALLVLNVLTAAVYLLAAWLNRQTFSLRRKRAGLAAAVILGLAGLVVLLLDHPFAPQSYSLAERFNSPFHSLSDAAALLPPEFILAFSGLLLFWRAVELAALPVEPALILGSFRLWTLVFLAYGLAGDAALSSALAVFLAGALFALVTARVHALSRLRGGRQSPFDRRWSLTIALSVSFSLGLALLIAALAQRYAGQVLAGAALFVRQAFLILVLALIIPPLSLFLSGLLRLGEALHFTAVLDQISQMIKRLLAFFESIFGPERQPPEIHLPFLKPVLLWGALLLLGVLLLSALGYRVWRYRRGDKEQVEALPAAADLAGRLRSRLKQQAAALAGRLAGLLRRPDRMLAAARIRRVYGLLLRLSAALGFPRPPASTPLEFLPVLEAAFPSLRQELRTITEAYLAVRYGELPESYHEVQAVDAAWRLLQAEGRLRLRKLAAHGAG